MSNIQLNQTVTVVNTTSIEMDGKVGKVEGFYGIDSAYAIVRFEEPLSNGYRSIVISIHCLE